MDWPEKRHRVGRSDATSMPDTRPVSRTSAAKDPGSSSAGPKTMGTAETICTKFSTTLTLVT